MTTWRHNAVSRYADMDRAAREKLGIILIAIFLGGWITVSFGIQIYQSNHHGYGFGITHRGYLPPEVRRQFGVPPDTTKEQLMERTNQR